MSNTRFIRAKKEDNFAILDTTCLRDVRLSWGAKGLHSYLQQLPSDWEINMSDLENRAKNGREALYTIVKELCEYGYFERIRTKDEKGKFVGYDYIVHEKPKNGFPVSGFPVNGQTVNGKPATTKYEETKDEKEVSINPSPETAFDFKNQLKKLNLFEDTVENRKTLWTAYEKILTADFFLAQWEVVSMGLPSVPDRNAVVQDWVIKGDFYPVNTFQLNKIRGWIETAGRVKPKNNFNGTHSNQKPESEPTIQVGDLKVKLSTAQRYASDDY